MDTMTPEQRKKCMQSNRSNNTSIEVTLRKALWKKGYRYRKNYGSLPGKPDIVLTKERIAIFCDSEFFHGKDWEVKKEKLQNCKSAEYWIRKIEKNMERDAENDAYLLSMGWTVIHFWGQDILKNTGECIEIIEETILDNMLSEVPYNTEY